MNRKEYVEARKALVAEAEGYANDGSRDKFADKKAEIEALDQKYESEVKARANARAMRDELEDLSGRMVGDDSRATNGEPIDRTGEARDRLMTRFGVPASAERGQLLKARNAVQLDTEGVLVPTRFSSELSPTFNEVSALIDRVRTFPRRGGEAFKRAYVRDHGEGAEVADDDPYSTADSEFGRVDINKSKVTVYTEEDEGVLKLPDVNYDAEIVAGVRIALRKRVTRQILVGPGSSNRITGVFSSTYDDTPGQETVGAIDPATDVPIAAIDNTTLDEIIFSYGGEEDVEDGAVLILNKLDLKAFAQLRDDNGNRFHTIRYDGNTGNIDGVQFIVNSAATAVSEAEPDDFVMAYGHLSNYGLAIFSEIDVRRSEDFKFSSGQIAHRGSVYLGGNVIAWNGFLRVKKSDEGGEGEGEA